MPRICFLLISMFFLHASGLAQSKGKLSGSVTDELKAIVVGVTVLITGKNFRNEIRTDESGKYEISLPPGKYKVEVPEAGGWHGSKAKRIRIRSEITAHFDFVLKGIRNDPDHP
jgi:hypothetical protein